jgi:lipoate---protein ligase
MTSSPSHDNEAPYGSTWRLLTSSGAGMGRQLALSEALLACLPEIHTPVLRWYHTNKPALVLGNGQKPETIDLAVARQRSIPVYRRTSGGTAVLVDGDALSMEVALPAGHPLATGDVVLGYRWFGEVWAQALRALGIGTARALPTDEVRALPPLAKDDPLRLACYGTLSPWEPVVGTRKVVGLSQVRRRGGTLYQVGVYLRWRPEALVKLLALPEGERAALVPRLRAATAGLDELAGRAVTVRAVTAAVEETLIELLNVRLERGAWTACEHEAAGRIQRERFRALGQ